MKQPISTAPRGRDLKLYGIVTSSAEAVRNGSPETIEIEGTGRWLFGGTYSGILGGHPTHWEELEQKPMPATDARRIMITLYEDYVNNFLTVPRFAEHHDLSFPQAMALLDLACKIYNTPHPAA